jgi:hypothetical protein
MSAHLISVHRENDTLTITADVLPNRNSPVFIRTNQDIMHVDGASVRKVSEGVSELTFTASNSSAQGAGYIRTKAILQFKPKR